MRSFVGACLTGALTIIACGGPPKQQDARASGTAPQAADTNGDADAKARDAKAKEAFTRQAHTDALVALDPLVEAYLARTQPVHYASALGEALATPYAPGADEASLRTDYEFIKKKLFEIRQPAQRHQPFVDSRAGLHGTDHLARAATALSESGRNGDGTGRTEPAERAH